MAESLLTLEGVSRTYGQEVLVHALREVPFAVRARGRRFARSSHVDVDVEPLAGPGLHSHAVQQQPLPRPN